MSHPLHGMFQKQNWGEESGVVLIKVLLFCILLLIWFSVLVVVKVPMVTVENQCG